jgi:hypothetical protein
VPTPTDMSALRGARPRAFLVLLGLAAAAGALVALDPSAVCLLPALVLVVPLVARRYPGERVLAKLATGWRRRRPRARSSTPRPRAVFAAVPRGGLLLARSLAVRPPPVLASAASR